MGAFVLPFFLVLVSLDAEACVNAEKSVVCFEVYDLRVAIMVGLWSILQVSDILDYRGRSYSPCSRNMLAFLDDLGYRKIKIFRNAFEFV